MAPPAWTQTIDNLFTSTWAYRKTKAEEQAFLKTPLIFWLTKKGQVEDLAGYSRVEIPVEYGRNETIRWISKGKNVPITDGELVTVAYDDWRHVSVSVVRWFAEDQKNRGKAQAIRLVDTKIKAAERAIWEEFERVMFADGTGDDEPNGLQNLIPNDPTSGTVHGLNRATYSWWRSQTKTASGAASVYLVPDMRTMLNNIAAYTGVEISDIIMVTDQTCYELYEDNCMELKQIQNSMLADAGFNNVTFKGRPLIWSPSAPSGKMFFLGTPFIKFYKDSEYFLEMTDWKEIPNQPFDRVAQIVCTLQLACSRPVATGVMHTIAA